MLPITIGYHGPSDQGGVDDGHQGIRHASGGGHDGSCGHVLAVDLAAGCVAQFDVLCNPHGPLSYVEQHVHNHSMYLYIYICIYIYTYIHIDGYMGDVMSQQYTNVMAF